MNAWAERGVGPCTLRMRTSERNIFLLIPYLNYSGTPLQVLSSSSYVMPVRV